MKRQSHMWPWAGVGLAAALAGGAACNALWGLDQPGYETSVAVAGVGGAAGASPVGGNGAGAAGSGDSGGLGGAAPACDLYAVGSCRSGEKCSIVDSTTGEVGCVSAGPRRAFSFCLYDTDCEDGTWCDETTFTCHPLCQTDNDCDVSGAQCFQGLSFSPNPGEFQDIPGLKLCAAHCEPKTAQGCQQGYGSTTCVYLGIGFDCAASNDQTEGLPCSFLNDCAIGLRCSGSPASCEPWCKVGIDICGATTDCCSLSPAVYYDGDEYGVCC